MVYRDEKRHLVADSLRELHAFAARAGIKRCWFDPDVAGGKPHYDVPKFLEAAVAASLFVKLVDTRQILEISKRLGRKD